MQNEVLIKGAVVVGKLSQLIINIFQGIKQVKMDFTLFVKNAEMKKRNKEEGEINWKIKIKLITAKNAGAP